MHEGENWRGARHSGIRVVAPCRSAGNKTLNVFRILMRGPWVMSVPVHMLPLYISFMAEQSVIKSSESYEIMCN